MDRRQALKKLGAGGATAIGASMIVSSQAFADGGSVTSRPTVPNPNVPVSNPTTITFPAAPCPYPPPAQARIDFRISGATITGGAVGPAYSIGPTTGQRQATITTTGFDVLFGSTALRIDVRYVCREPGGVVAAWTCKSWDVTVVFFGVNLAVQPNPTICNTPAPT